MSKNTNKIDDSKSIKNIQKSIRISNNTYDCIMKFSGRTFNAKLERAFSNSELLENIEKLENKIVYLNQSIERIEYKKDFLHAVYFNYDHICKHLQRIQRELNNADCKCGLNDEIYSLKTKLNYISSGVNNANAYIDELENHQKELKKKLDFFK